MASCVNFVMLSLFCVVTMTNCRIVIYDSDYDSKTSVDVGEQLIAIKKVLVNLSASMNALNKHMAGILSTTPSSTLTSKRKCEEGWFPFRESCYFVVTNKINYHSVERKCQQLKAYVVRLETREENQFLKTFMVDHSIKNGSIWIGITDLETEGVWKIVGTNQEVPFIDWRSNEPNDKRGEDCALLYNGAQSGWIDVSCDSSYYAVCEKKVK